MYSSLSGSYSNYLSNRQSDEIKKTIEKESNQQKFMYAIGTDLTIDSINQVGDKIDSVNTSIQRMSTGIQTSINQNTYTIAASSMFLSETFNNGFDSVNNTLDLGFAGVNTAIGSMSASMSAGFDALQKSMDYWGTEICEKLDAIHEIVNNPLLTASRELFHRAENNAAKKFYEEALEDIKSAVEKNKTDYLSWGLMGKIYLFGASEFSNVVDVPKALEAFTNACKYVSPDVDESYDAKMIASEFYFYAGYANYILSNESRLENKTDDVTKYLQASVTANAKSFALSEKMLEAAYNQARSLNLLKQKDKVLSILENVIRADGLYSIKALGDADFKDIESDIISLITKLREEYKKNFKELFNDFNSKYELFGGNYCEKIEDLMARGEELAKSDCQYLDIRFFYKCFDYEYSKIKKSQHPMDLKVFENKITEDFKFKTKFDVCISKKWKEDPYHNVNSLDLFYYKHVYENQITLYNTEKCSYDGPKTIKCKSYALLQNSYGEKGKFILNEVSVKGRYKSEHFYPDEDEGHYQIYDFVKDSNGDYHRRKNEQYCASWMLDDNTIVKYENKKNCFTAYQRGIVSKKYLEEWQKRNDELNDKISKFNEAERIDKEYKETLSREKFELEEKRRKQRPLQIIICIVSIVIGILLFMPMVRLGGRIWNKCGYVIFACLDIIMALLLSTIPVLVIEHNNTFRDIVGTCFSIGMIPIDIALFTTALKIGLIIGHPFLGGIAGVVIGIILSFIIINKTFD